MWKWFQNKVAGSIIDRKDKEIRDLRWSVGRWSADALFYREVILEREALINQLKVYRFGKHDPPDFKSNKEYLDYLQDAPRVTVSTSVEVAKEIARRQLLDHNILGYSVGTEFPFPPEWFDEYNENYEWRPQKNISDKS